MNEMSTTQIINQVNELKQRVRGLLENSKRRIIYQIWALNPNANADYQMYGNGDTTKDGRDYEKFEREIDLVLNSPSIAKLKVTITDGKKPLGDTEIVIKSAYAQMQISFPKPLPANDERGEQPKPIVNTFQFLDIFNTDTGLNGDLGGLGGLGAVLAVRDKLIENKYEKRDYENKMQNYAEQNAVLRAKNLDNEAKIEKLERELDNAETTIDDLEDALNECKFANSQNNKILGFDKEQLAGLAFQFFKGTKLAGSLGLVDETPEVPAASAIPNVAAVQIEPVEEKPTNPRQPYYDAVVKFMNGLTDEQFTAFWHLLGIFQKAPKTAISACLSWATGTPANAATATSVAGTAVEDEY
jgi:hypothetical protein